MINISINDKSTGLKKQLKIKKNVSGHYMMTEHPDIDVIIMPDKTKILLLGKNENSDMVYRLQDKMFQHLCSQGVITPDTIKGGNVYGSMEATFPKDTSDGKPGLLVALYNIAQYIEDQRPIFKAMLKHKKELEDSLLNPSIKDSTELGEVPQETFKGSIPKYGFPTRGIYRYNY